MLKKLSPLVPLMLFSSSAFALSRMPELNVRDVVWFIVQLAGVAVVFGLLDYGVKSAPFISEPIKGFIHWALIVIACLLLIFIILSFIGL